jgi:LmbE family N-acetylglucosaminyl deacetylase
VARITLDMPNRYLTDTVDNRMQVAEVIRRVRPDIMCVPYWVDARPDHVAAATLGEAARFYGKLTKTSLAVEPFMRPRILHFFSTHYRLHPDPAFVFDISAHVDRKRQPFARMRRNSAWSAATRGSSTT